MSKIFTDAYGQEISIGDLIFHSPRTKYGRARIGVVISTNMHGVRYVKANVIQEPGLPDNFSISSCKRSRNCIVMKFDSISNQNSKEMTTLAGLVEHAVGLINKREKFNHKDQLGQDINVGDFVVYGASAFGGGAVTRCGIVTKLNQTSITYLTMMLKWTGREYKNKPKLTCAFAPGQAVIIKNKEYDTPELRALKEAFKNVK